ncbi:histidine phosphatase family protein [Mycolicibacterium diernhoferi]|nr:histidine phosphatase family protein [Mycolicibacterium diernhoferi]QYL23677.1 histidine phosphatase family protein [Mycolicibacterium diernhoferi]
MNSAATATHRGWRRTKLGRYVGSVFVAGALLAGAAIPASAAELMRVTFIRHGQSLGNASGTIDSSTPGPVLSELGQQQAAAVAARLGDKNYDGVYASTMVRTQLTAAPMSQYLGLPIKVLAGMREIEAGDYEGTPESEASSGYMLAPLAWSLQGNLDARIPGSLDGHEFNARVGGALQSIYDDGSRNAVVFSHGAAMMFWTFMNVDNLTAAQKMELLRASLRNTADVVIEGNPVDGWKLVSWDGRQFSADRTFLGELTVQLRTLVRQVGAEFRSVLAAFATRDLSAIVSAVNRAVSTASFSAIKFTRAINADVVQRIEKAVSRILPKRSASAATMAGAAAAAATAPTVAESVETQSGPETVRERRSARVAPVSVPTVDEVTAIDEVVEVTDEAELDIVTDVESGTASDITSDVESDVESGSKSDVESDLTADSKTKDKADALAGDEADTKADKKADNKADEDADKKTSDKDGDTGTKVSVGATSAAGGSDSDD